MQCERRPARERLRASVRRALNRAYAAGDAGPARRLPGNLARQLNISTLAPRCSRTAGTLTVMRPGLSDNLEGVLSSANLFENLFSRVREIGRRV
jgi:hypothetical protein